MCIPQTSSAGTDAVNRNIPVHPVHQNPKQPEGSQKVDRLGRDVIELLKGAIQQAQKAKGKDLVALVGNTGTGKSTAVNQLLGKKMECVRRKIQVKEGEEEIAKIGHRAATSETRYAHVYDKAGTQLIFADCGGFFDTRGVSTDIAVVTSLKLTLENANSAKLVLCFDSNVLTTDRVIHFSQAINLTLGTLLKDYKKHASSILIMFTKPMQYRDGSVFDAAMAIQMLKEIRDDLMDGPQKKLYNFILRNEGKYIAVCDPLSDDSRDKNLATLLEMGPIENTKEAFQTAYSAHSQLKLLEEMTAIGVTGCDLYGQYFSNQETMKRYQEEIIVLKSKVENINKSIQEIGNGKNDPASIQSEENAIIAENKNIILQQQDRIAKLKSLIDESNLRIEAINEKIALMDKRGEEEIDYWTDQINQEGINIETKTVTVTTHEKKGVFSGSSHTDTTTSSTFDKRAIPRDFIYRGPIIARVVKDPADGSCWTNEVKSHDSYAIHYESGKGQPAIASVKVFIKRKQLPDEVHERSGHEKNIGQERVVCATISSDIGNAQELIYKAELAISAKGSTLEKLEIFTKAVKEMENALADYNQKLSAKVKETVDLEDVIKANQDDFSFLKSYLELSNDNNLKAKEIISKFLTLHHEYARIVS